MNKYSLHIGLNEIDPKYYGDKYKLNGCINDALSMQKICKSLYYDQTVILTDKAATTTNVVSRLLEFSALSYKYTSHFTITYSGHGGQVQDRNYDESDGLDEAWCLYDSMMVDDHLYKLLSEFSSMSRITVISDSCHSGSITRNNPFLNLFQTRQQKFCPVQPKVFSRVKESNILTVKAGLLTLSACQDAQIAWDNGDHGLFTKSFLKNYKDGIGAVEMVTKIRKQIIAQQNPRLTYKNMSIIGAKIF